jgi:hypothetical protein
LTVLPAAYDGNKQAWVASAKFPDSNDLPVNVDVDFVVDNPNIPIDRNYVVSTFENIKDTTNIIVQNISNEEIYQGTLSTYEYAGNTYTLKNTIIPLNNLPDITNYEKIELYDNYLIYQQCNFSQNNTTIECIYPRDLLQDLVNNGNMKDEEIEELVLQAINEYSLNYLLIRVEQCKDVSETTLRGYDIDWVWDQVEWAYEYTKNAFEKFGKVKQLAAKVEALRNCTDLIDEATIDELADLVNGLYSSYFKINAATEIMKKLSSSKHPITWVISFSGETLGAAAEIGFMTQYKKLSIYINTFGQQCPPPECHCNCKCCQNGNQCTKCNCCETGHCTCFPHPPGEPTPDPSGYVYETVTSNRLQGVTASVYYETEEENMYGECIKKTVLWNAEDYEQVNPQITDEFGQYSWFVPQGLWQVKYEKEGYQTTYSDWLPVPPPQLDVNIAMVQATQPEVKAAQGYESGIHIEFNKFMLPASLQPDSISVTRNDAAVKGTVELLNHEASPQNSDEIFASKVKFVPQTSFVVSDEVILTVKRNVQSYAGVQMAEDFVATIPIRREMQSITTESALTVLLNESSELQVVVSPKAAGSGKRITARSVSSAIAAVTAEAILNQDGEATLQISGELPGATVVYISVDSADLKAQVAVNVKMPVAVSSIALNKTSLTLEVGKTETLTAIVLPSDASNQHIVWASSNIDVAIVESGIVSAIGKGTALITATTADGNKTANCEVSVTQQSGIENVSVNQPIIHPNPAKNEIFIKSGLPIKKVEIYSLTGALLLSENRNVEKIAVSNLAQGVYIVKIYTESGGFVWKLAKE